MQKRIILLLYLLCNSCKFTENKESVDELLIYGYSGFCLKDSLNHQIYPCDDMSYNDCDEYDNFEFDSTQLDIRQYFEFRKDSFVNVAVRKPGKNTDFIKIAQSDTIGFENLINTALVNKKYKTHYSFKDNEAVLYDGWHFTLYYKTSKNKEFSIDYIPSYLPDSLRTLHEFVEKIMLKDNPELTKKIEYNSMTIEKAKSLFKNFPPPRQIQEKIKIKFLPPENIKEN